MCHKDRVKFFGRLLNYEAFSEEVDGLCFPHEKASTNVAVLPDIYGLSDFYKGYASYLTDFGAQVCVVDPWSPFDAPADLTRDAAWERRHRLRDREHCDRLEKFLARKRTDAVVGFCIGGNFVLELARRGFKGTLIAVYPLPWGMKNQDEIAPAFEYMATLIHKVTILMGDADRLAGPGNVKKIEGLVVGNENLKMHLYKGSGHGFFSDVDGTDRKLKLNAKDAIDQINKILFAG